MTENLWAAEQSALVRGLAHALSNRVGTIVAVGGMLMPDAPAAAPVVGMLRDEGDRLEELLALMRLLGADDRMAEPEPIHLPDIVMPVVELHSHHPALRDVPCAMTPDPAAPPVRARHAGLVRALLVLLSAAKGGGEAARLGWAPDGRDVVLTVDGAAGATDVAAAAAELLGGEVAATGSGYAVRLSGL